jgi:hypothetical protein
MPIPETYRLDASQYAKDFRAIAQARLLDQFKGKPNLTAVLNAFADEAQEAFDVFLACLPGRSLFEATGTNLDAIGRIVGQRRELISNDAPVPWWYGDSTDHPPDVSENWVPGAVDTGVRAPNDDEYRMQILGRIFSNMARFASVPELQAMIEASLGCQASFVPTAGSPMTVDIVIHGLSTNTARYLLNLKKDTERTQDKFFVPYPATLTINSITTA